MRDCCLLQPNCSSHGMTSSWWGCRRDASRSASFWAAARELDGEGFRRERGDAGARVPRGTFARRIRNDFRALKVPRGALTAHRRRHIHLRGDVEPRVPLREEPLDLVHGLVRGRSQQLVSGLCGEVRHQQPQPAQVDSSVGQCFDMWMLLHENSAPTDARTPRERASDIISDGARVDAKHRRRNGILQRVRASHLDLEQLALESRQYKSPSSSRRRAAVTGGASHSHRSLSGLGPRTRPRSALTLPPTSAPAAAPAPGTAP